MVTTTKGGTGDSLTYEQGEPTFGWLRPAIRAFAEPCR